MSDEQPMIIKVLPSDFSPTSTSQVVCIRVNVSQMEKLAGLPQEGTIVWHGVYLPPSVIGQG